MVVRNIGIVTVLAASLAASVAAKAQALLRQGQLRFTSEISAEG